MSRSNPRQNNSAFKGLQYRPQVPAFLAKMQRAAAGGGGRSPSPTEDGAVIVGGSRRSASPVRRGADGRVRESVPERPRDGKWAGGSDDEGDNSGKGKAKAVDGETDEWEERWGGGMDGDGPQIVVLKEGKHMSEAEVMAAKRGETQETTKTDISSLEAFHTTLPANKPPKPSNSYTSSISKSALLAESLSAKRKASSLSTKEDPVKAAKLKKKEVKKEKEKKGLLSFDDE